jgi:hypothetical protein
MCPIKALNSINPLFICCIFHEVLFLIIQFWYFCRMYQILMLFTYLPIYYYLTTFLHHLSLYIVIWSSGKMISKDGLAKYSQLTWMYSLVIGQQTRGYSTKKNSDFWDTLTMISENWICQIYVYIITSSPSQWPRGLRRGSASGRLLGLRVRIPPGEWMSVSFYCCVLSGRDLCVGLITRPEESYRVWCVWL